MSLEIISFMTGLKGDAIESYAEGANLTGLRGFGRKGEMIGVLGAQIDNMLFSDAIAASSMLFYVVPEWRRSLAAVKLLHAYVRWAKAMKAEAINMHVTSGAHLRNTDKLMRRLGFQQIGGNYVFK